ncbi:MAG: Fe-Mn family superoxide dismutase [Myxococcales bacterium]
MERSYKVREFPHLKGLKGLSDVQIEQHLKLYEGYVKQTNLLREQITDMVAKGQSDQPIFAELVRRLPFEQNGMVLHEYYFDNMIPNGGDLPKGGALNKAIDESFGSIDNYKKELMSMAKMRGIGWVMTLQDPTTGWLCNRWVTQHEQGNIAGYRPVLVLDVWEHAFTVDYKPTERAKYLDAWFANVNWKKVEERVSAR